MGAALWALLAASSTRIASRLAPLAAPASARSWCRVGGEEVEMLGDGHDEERIVERVATLDIGKAELVC
jgi:hypothetical protein